MKYLMIMLLALFTGLSMAKEPAPFTPEQERQIEALIQKRCLTILPAHG